MDTDWLKEAYRRTRKDGAVGVDGVTAAEYEQDLEGNLQRLLDRAKSGTVPISSAMRMTLSLGFAIIAMPSASWMSCRSDSASMD